MAVRADVVYAEPLNPPPHGLLRNLASRLAKRAAEKNESGVRLMMPITAGRRASNVRPAAGWTKNATACWMQCAA